MKYILTLFLLMGITLPIQATYYYTPYSFSYHQAGWWNGRWYPAGNYAWVNGSWYLQGYGYHYGYLAPYAFPVAQFIGVPVPILGSFYVGSSSVQTYSPPVTATVTTIAPTTVVPTAGRPTPGGVPNELVSLLREVTNELKKTNSEVANLRSDINFMKRDFDLMKADIARIKGLPAPTPTPTPKPKEDKEEPKEVKDEDMKVWNNSCAACHLRGNHIRNKGTAKEKEGFVILETKDKRATLSAKQLKKMVEVLTEGTMPPPDNDKKIPPLNERDTSIAIVGITRFPVKE